MQNIEWNIKRKIIDAGGRRKTRCTDLYSFRTETTISGVHGQYRKKILKTFTLQHENQS